MDAVGQLTINVTTVAVKSVAAQTHKLQKSATATVTTGYRKPQIQEVRTPNLQHQAPTSMRHVLGSLSLALLLPSVPFAAASAQARATSSSIPAAMSVIKEADLKRDL
jgi:hypothetical protein